jgi:hypothetical protein
MIAGVVSILLAYGRPVAIIRTDMKPGVAFRRMQLHMRGIGYIASPGEKKLTVLLDDYKTARIGVRPTEQGSQVSVYPGLTSGSIYSVYLLSIILPFCGVIVVGMSYRSIIRTREFSDSILVPSLFYLEAQKEGWGEEAGTADLRLVTINSLQKADSLANQALMSIKSFYQGVALATLIFGLYLYGIAFFVFTDPNSTVGDWSYGGRVSSGITFLATLVIIGGLLWLYRERYLDLTTGLRAKIRDLEASIAREQGLVPVTDSDESGLSVLLRAWPELPRWVKYSRRDISQRNPGISVVIFGMVMISVFVRFFEPWGWYVMFALWAATAILYGIAKVKDNRKDKQILEEWNSRIEALNAKMESNLGAL